MDEAQRTHWQRIYAERSPAALSWFQLSAKTSLNLIVASKVGKGEPIVDVGAGASTLVDGLLERGYTEVYLLDVADAAFARTRTRLGVRSGEAQYIVADIAKWRPVHRFGLWHDRALFHFMADAASRDSYKQTLRAALGPGAKAIIATFALDGPETCSGLPVQRYSAETLAKELGGVLKLVESRQEMHRTPTGGTQSFVYGLFERV